MRLAQEARRVNDLFRREQKTVDTAPVVDPVELSKRLMAVRKSVQRET